MKDPKKPILRVRGDTITVTNPYNNKSFKVSKVDRALVENTLWTVSSYKNKATVSRSPGYPKRKHIYLKRVIMAAKPGEFVMFMNRNELDLRRENMRICTRAQYTRNQCVSIRNTSGYKGVSWDRFHEKWKASIRINRHGLHIGYYKSPTTAYNAYKQVAKIVHEGFNYV